MSAQTTDLRNNGILAGFLKDHIVNTCGPYVQSGPFAGMQILPESTWSYDIPARLLGTYESELHDILLRGRFERYDTVIDVGCADGFYAVGLALLYQEAQIFAYDYNQAAQDLTRRNTEVNKVADRVHIRATCDAAALEEHARSSKRLFVICDCEGFELELFKNHQTVSALKSADVIVETHAFVDPRCTDIVRGYFSSTHDVQVIGAGARDPNRFAVLRTLGEDDRWRGVCEYRPYSMEWLFCKARR